MKITIVKMGYVDLSNGLCLGEYNKVERLDIVSNKLKMLNSQISLIEDTFYKIDILWDSI